MADSAPSSATQLVGAYLSSKGLPMTGENIRRALEQNAANPGLIKGLVNQAPPPPDAQGGASPTSNQQGSAPAALATRMGQAIPTPPIPPQQQAAQPTQGQPQPGQPLAPPGIMGMIAQLVLGGGAGALAGLAGHGGAPGVPSGAGGELPQLGIPIPGQTPQLGGQAALPAPQAALPAPPTPGGPAQLSGPAQLPQIAPNNMVPGVNPIGPPQPGRMDTGPGTAIPMPPAPTGAAPASDVASHAPVSIVPRVAGADAADLGGHMDWSKILGEIGSVIGHR